MQPVLTSDNGLSIQTEKALAAAGNNSSCKQQQPSTQGTDSWNAGPKQQRDQKGLQSRQGEHMAEFKAGFLHALRATDSPLESWL